MALGASSVTIAAAAAGGGTGVPSRRVEQSMVGIRPGTGRVEEDDTHTCSNK
jgi:hypothetical protein